MAGRRRVAVLISGRGSNMASLIEAAQDPAYPAEIVLVVSNRPERGGLERARAAGIATASSTTRRHPDRASFDAALDATLREHGIEIVCLAGFMRILTPGLSSSPGPGACSTSTRPCCRPSRARHARTGARGGVAKHGCTVHFVTPELDSGPIVAQAEVPVLPDDTEDDLRPASSPRSTCSTPARSRLVASGQATSRPRGSRNVVHGAAS
jgi:phosphoribosylglycinamide formyltransferase-1